MKRLWHTLTLYHLREDISLCDCGYAFGGGSRCPLRVWAEARRMREMLTKLPYGRA